MQHKLRDTWAKGAGAVNAWLAIPSPVTAEIAAMQDFDSVTVDLQHGLNDYQIALSMLQAISTSDKTALVRVPWLGRRERRASRVGARLALRSSTRRLLSPTRRCWCSTPARSV